MYITDPSKEWAVIAYVRLSDEDRDKTEDEKSRSIENQIKYLEQYAQNMKNRGENISGYITVCDDGKTGTDTKRTGFKKAVSLLEEGKYNCLLVSDLSRGFRNIADQTYYLEEYFPVHNIRFISTALQYVDSYLEPQSAMNLGVKIQGITNEQFAYDTSVKIRSKFDLKRRLGEFIGAFAPYGYDKMPGNNDAFIIDEEAAGVVRSIFAWYTAELMSLGAVVKKLNSLGIPNPTKYKNDKGLNLKNPSGNDGLWSPSSVRRVLTNEVYLGKMIQGREEIINYKVHKSRKKPKESWYVVEGTHEPVIEAATFQKARELLSMNARAGSQGFIYPLGGLLKCGECNKAMSRKTAKGIAYYSCRTYRDKGKQFCYGHSVREDMLFDAVLEAVNQQIRRVNNMDAILRRAEKSMLKSADTRALETKLDVSRRDLENEIAVFDKTYYDFSRGVISEEQFIRIRRICEKRQSELNGVIRNLSGEIERAGRAGLSKSSALKAFIGLLKKEKRAAKLTRGLAFELIESVYVSKDKSVEVNFRFASPR
ncbi:MAG: recombinase family protein [Clostridiales bacterium]|jgi:hypothetical protein|nr:recombinase family protein [Clostridiales bacterium]